MVCRNLCSSKVNLPKNVPSQVADAHEALPIRASQLARPVPELRSKSIPMTLELFLNELLRHGPSRGGRFSTGYVQRAQFAKPFAPVNRCSYIFKTKLAQNASEAFRTLTRTLVRPRTSPRMGYEAIEVSFNFFMNLPELGKIRHVYSFIVAWGQSFGQRLEAVDGNCVVRPI